MMTPQIEKEMAQAEHEGAMPILAHLRELHHRVMHAVYGALVAIIVTLPFSKQIFDILVRPAAMAWEARKKMADSENTSGLGQLLWTDPTATVDIRAVSQELLMTGGPARGFMLYLKVGLGAALLLATPWIAWQIWRFVAPGLYHRERATIRPYGWFTTIAFIAGVSFAYFLVLPNGLFFFMGQGADHARMLWTIDEFFRFELRLLLAFGIAFQLPLFMSLLARLGAVRAEAWRAARPVAVPVIFLLSAALTPPDIVTQVAMGIPMTLLYEVGILWASRAESKSDRAQQPQEQ